MGKYLILLFTLLMPVVAYADTSKNKKTEPINIINLDKMAKLENGYYLLPQFIDLKKKTYSTEKGYDLHPIYGEFEIEQTNKGTQFKGGNFHEGLLTLVVDKKGKVEGNPCFARFCIDEVKAITAKSFAIKVNGKEQKFISTNGLRAIEY